MGIKEGMWWNDYNLDRITKIYSPKDIKFDHALSAGNWSCDTETLSDDVEILKNELIRLESKEKEQTMRYKVTTQDGKVRHVKAYSFFMHQFGAVFTRVPKQDNRLHQTYQTTGFYYIADIKEIIGDPEPKVEVTDVSEAS